MFFCAQRVKTIAYGGGRHRLQPQPFDGVLAFGVLLDEPENQLAFAARVARIDYFVDVFSLCQFDDGVQPRLGFVHRFQVKVRRQHGQIGKAPLATLDIKLFGGLNFNKMADSGGDDPVVTFKILVVFFKLASRRRHGAHDVLRDRRFFCNN